MCYTIYSRLLSKSVVLAGVKRPDQLLSNIEAMGWHLDKDELEKLNNMSLSGDNINE